MTSRQKKVAILIKTCRSRPSLLWVLNSIKFGLKDVLYRIYISDEKPLNKWKVSVYERLREEGHHIETHQSGISCGLARNKLLAKLQDEELVLRLDDDFELGGEFDFEALKTVVMSSKEIGFCSDYERQFGNNKGVNSGSLRPGGGEIIVSQPKIVKRFHSPLRKLKKVKGYRYSLAAFTRNLLLIKRDVLEEVKWNETLLFKGEHLEFMLSVKEAGYKGAYTPDSIHYHRDDLPLSPDFEQKFSGLDRPGEIEMKQVFKKKWGCEQIETKYPMTWYFLEGGRRVISKILPSD